jgi:hypothetical protein
MPLQQELKKLTRPNNFIFQTESYTNLSKSDDRKPDSQCTYNVTLRLVRATVVAVEKK